MKSLFLRNHEGQLIRAFSCETEKAFLVYRRKPRRLDLCSAPGFFEKERGFVTVIKEFSIDQLKERRISLKTGHYLERGDQLSFDQSENILSFPFCEPEDPRDLRRAAASVIGAFAALIGGLLLLSEKAPEEKPAEERRQIVQIIKPPQIAKLEKITIGSQTSYTRESKAPAEQKKLRKKALKRRGALAALGSLSKSRNPAGLHLGAAKVSSGPGLKASSSNSGSGGVQGSIYSKGMITAALGSGGNIKGGGGYGLKGSLPGGGQAGAGQLTLVGSGGAWDLSETNSISYQGGDFDPSLIEREIIRRIGKIRECYNQALRKEPKLKGLFSAHFTINSKGKVASSRRHPSSPVRSPGITNCILGVLSAIKFDLHSENQDLISVVYPFNLTNLEGAALGAASLKNNSK